MTSSNADGKVRFDRSGGGYIIFPAIKMCDDCEQDQLVSHLLTLVSSPSFPRLAHAQIL